MTRTEWLLLSRQALALTLQAERTRKLWVNPLSIYGPDPARLAAVEFNAGKAERARDLREGLDELRADLGALKVKKVSSGHGRDAASASTNRKNWRPRVPGVGR